MARHICITNLISRRWIWGYRASFIAEEGALVQPRARGRSGAAVVRSKKSDGWSDGTESHHKLPPHCTNWHRHLYYYWYIYALLFARRRREQTLFFSITLAHTHTLAHAHTRRLVQRLSFFLRWWLCVCVCVTLCVCVYLCSFRRGNFWHIFTKSDEYIYCAC